MDKILTSEDIIERLHKAGLLPRWCGDVTIEAGYNRGQRMPTISFHCAMSEDILKALGAENDE